MSTNRYCGTTPLRSTQCKPRVKSPTVEEVLKLAKGRVAFTFELKSPAGSPGVATKLAALLKKYDRVFVGDTIEYYNERHVIEDVYSYIVPVS